MSMSLNDLLLSTRHRLTLHLKIVRDAKFVPHNLAHHLFLHSHTLNFHLRMYKYSHFRAQSSLVGRWDRNSVHEL